MNRLVIFGLMMVALVTVLSLKNYKNLPVTNSKFNLAKAEEAHEAHVKELAELAEKQNPTKKAEVEVVKEEGPLVVLDTPELQNGSTLYSKCIVCHGKHGEGKKSQNAPRIGGQFADYIEQQIVAMKSGARVNQKMNPYIKKLSTQDIKDIASYLSRIPWGK